MGMHLRNTAIVAAALVSLRCGSDSRGLGLDVDGGGGTGGSLTFEKACTESAAFCERIDACAPYLLKLVWGDAKTCAERLKISCLDESRAPGVTISPADYVACTSAIRAAKCD